MRVRETAPPAKLEASLSVSLGRRLLAGEFWALWWIDRERAPEVEDRLPAALVGGGLGERRSLQRETCWWRWWDKWKSLWTTQRKWWASLHIPLLFSLQQLPVGAYLHVQGQLNIEEFLILIELLLHLVPHLCHLSILLTQKATRAVPLPRQSILEVPDLCLTSCQLDQTKESQSYCLIGSNKQVWRPQEQSRSELIIELKKQRKSRETMKNWTFKQINGVYSQHQFEEPNSCKSIKTTSVLNSIDFCGVCFYFKTWMSNWFYIVSHIHPTFFTFSTALAGRLCLMFCTPALKYEKYHPFL